MASSILSRNLALLVSSSANFRSINSRLLNSSIPKARVQQVRRMASAKAPTVPEGKFEWLVILPDVEGKLSKRMEIRSKHFEGLQKNIENGFFKMGGAIMNELPKEGQAMDFKGSALVCVAANKEEIYEVLKSDIYTENDVWDFSNIQMYPFKCGFRIP